MGKKLTCRRAGQASARVFRTARGSCGISESNGRTSPGSPPVLQPALDAPDLVNTVAVLEPFIASVIMGSLRKFAGTMAKVGSMYATGDRVGALEVFPLAVAGDGFRETFDRTLPLGYFVRWVEAADTIFQNDARGVMSWSFSAGEAARIRQPFLNVAAASTGTQVGASTARCAVGCHRLRTWRCSMRPTACCRAALRERPSCWPASFAAIPCARDRRQRRRHRGP
jgi:hypothetical protein